MNKLDRDFIDGILFLTLNDSSSKNAFSPSIADEFLKSFRDKSLTGVLLKSTGSVFCSGGNLSFYKGLKSKENGLKHNRRIAEILDTFENLSVPKVCVVNGLCVGGGVELISSFDKVFATPQSLFGLWQRRVGLTFGWGGQRRLLKRMTQKSLDNWLLEASTLSAYGAKDLGLIDKVGLETAMESEAIAWIKSVQERGVKSLEAIRSEPDQQDQVFEKLWMDEEHLKALSKIAD